MCTCIYVCVLSDECVCIYCTYESGYLCMQMWVYFACVLHLGMFVTVVK